MSCSRGGGGGGTSTFVIRWVNFITMVTNYVPILCSLIIALHDFRLNVGLATASSCSGHRIRGVDEHSSRQLSKVSNTANYGSRLHNIFSIHRWVLGRTKEQLDIIMDLWMYLLMLCLVLVGILVFTAVVFIVTNSGSGHNVAGLRYKEYQLQDYGSLFIKKLNNHHNWKHIQSCFVKNKTCNSLSKRYKTLKQFKLAKLTPIEAGCCRPPSQCGYPVVNASYYDISFHPLSSNKDCKLYKNLKAVKCYNCDSCKAGVAQYIKTEWRVIAIFNMIVFVVLSMIYFVGCCARRDAARINSKS